MSFVVAALYHFFEFPDFVERRPALLAQLLERDIKGSLLVASEGVNGTLAGSREAIDGFLTYLRDEIIRGPFTHKESFCETQPFERAKVRIKKEVISLGEPVNPKRRTGIYVKAQDWNELISDPNVIVIDARNDYEIHLGTFERAIDPGTRNFKQLPKFVRENLDPNLHCKVATFCTGGIRCEKFSAWLLEQGFPEVYQLDGGILKYLEELTPEQSAWKGECYVFDERVAVGHGLAPSTTATLCPACGNSLTSEDRASEVYREGVSCPWCIGRENA